MLQTLSESLNILPSTLTTYNNYYSLAGVSYYSDGNIFNDSVKIS